MKKKMFPAKAPKIKLAMPKVPKAPKMPKIKKPKM